MKTLLSATAALLWTTFAYVVSSELVYIYVESQGHSPQVAEQIMRQPEVFGIMVLCFVASCVVVFITPSGNNG